MSVSNIVTQAIGPIIEGLGYEIVEIEYKKQYDSMNLTVYIDSPTGISLDDCEKVHKAIDGPLDELDPTQGKPYVLNVSSPGIDRPIKTMRGYLKNKGKKVEVSLYAPINGEKKYSGELSTWSEDKLGIIIDNKLIEFNHKDIALLKPII